MQDIVHGHRRVRIFQKASQYPLLIAANQDEARVALQRRRDIVAKSRREYPAVLEAGGHIGEKRFDRGDIRQMGQRIAHAQDRVHRAFDLFAEGEQIRFDGADGQGACPRSQLVQQRLISIERDHGKPAARQRQSVQAQARAKVDSGSGGWQTQ
jgi:hypothetical protein